VINSGRVSELVRTPAWRIVTIGIVVVALLAAGCGDDEDEGGAGTTATQTSAQSDRDAERGFLEAMVPHHDSAIEMAEVAVERAEAPEIKKLAEAIRDAQEPEIEQMRKIHERLFGSALKPNMAGHEALGLSAEEAGMAGHEEMMKELETADPFDRAFIDAMVPHHEGAVKMAEVVLTKTEDAELKKLAQTIIDTQNREISEMNDFRTKTYGGPVPEKSTEDGGGHEEEGH
jgi:uncharacterized protein (DUF305 family)